MDSSCEYVIELKSFESIYVSVIVVISLGGFMVDASKPLRTTVTQLPQIYVLAWRGLPPYEHPQCKTCALYKNVWSPI